MDRQTKSTRIQGLLSLFDFQTDFFPRVLDGISEEDMYNRLHTEANHPSWLAGSLVNQRFLMASEMKHDLVMSGHELFHNNKGIQAGASYPSRETYLSDWQQITPVARRALLEIDDQKLDSLFDMGGMKMTYYDLTCFTIYREASIIGQLALWRRLLGYPAMRYD